MQAFEGSQAVQLVKERLIGTKCPCRKQFKIIFMDLSMPVMDGYEASEKIREMENMNAIPQN